MDTDRVEEFVAPFYAGKDSMHGIGHVKAMLRRALELQLKHGGDRTIITYAAYFHGLVPGHLKEVRKFLGGEALTRRQREKVVKAARESHADATARTNEGKLLHDAHLTSGGRDSLVVRALATGVERGQGIKESLDFLEKQLGTRKCYLPECQAGYSRREDYARKAIAKLRNTL
jgi:uncharacterized protein